MIIRTPPQKNRKNAPEEVADLEPHDGGLVHVVFRAEEAHVEGEEGADGAVGVVG